MSLVFFFFSSPLPSSLCLYIPFNISRMIRRDNIFQPILLLLFVISSVCKIRSDTGKKYSDIFYFSSHESTNNKFLFLHPSIWTISRSILFSSLFSSLGISLYSPTSNLLVHVPLYPRQFPSTSFLSPFLSDSCHLVLAPPSFFFFFFFSLFFSTTLSLPIAPHFPRCNIPFRRNLLATFQWEKRG